MIDLTTLGTLDVRDPTRGALASLLAQPRRAALLVYLAVEGGEQFVSRDTLLGVFWPDSDETRGRAALRQALAFLRRVLGTEALRTQGDDGVGVDLSLISCDALEFMRAAAEHRDDEALRMYGGPFLHGVLIDEAPVFEQWCSGVRERLARTAVRAADAQCGLAMERGDWRAAVEAARRGESIEPFNEQLHRRLLMALAASGDRANALLEHERFSARLLADLEVTPSAETQALVTELRRPAEVPVHAPSVATAVATAAVTADGSVHTASLAANSRVRWFAGSALAAALLLVVFVVRQPTATLPESDLPNPATAEGSRIVVMPLTDETRDTTFGPLGRMAADWITEGVSRVDGVQVVPVSVVLATETALRDSLNRNLQDAWRTVAVDVGASVVVRGAVYRDQRTLHFQAQLIDAKTGSVLRAIERVSVSTDSVMAGIDLLRSRVVAAVAPLADTVTHLRRAIAPPTYESYRAYVNGLQTFVNGDPRRALTLFEQSASADSSYPMPRIAAAIMHVNLRDANSAARLVERLQTERDRLGPLERSTLDMTDALLNGQLERAYDAALRQAHVAPGTIGEYMVAETARKMNRPEEAVSVLRALGPDRGELRGWRPYWRELTYALHLLGEHAQELEAALEAQHRYPTDRFILSFVVRAHAARGDMAALSRAYEAAQSMSPSASYYSALRVIALSEWMAHGHVGASAMVDSTLAWFETLDAASQSDPAVRHERAHALVLANRGRDALAQLAFVPSRSATTTFEELGLYGVAAAQAGDSAEASRAMAWIERKSSALNRVELGSEWGAPSYWQSAIAAQHGDSARALALFREARRAGLGMEPSVHAEPAFAGLRQWPPFRALLVPAARTATGTR